MIRRHLNGIALRAASWTGARARLIVRAVSYAYPFIGFRLGWREPERTLRDLRCKR